MKSKQIPLAKSTLDFEIRKKYLYQKLHFHVKHDTWTKKHFDFATDICWCCHRESDFATQSTTVHEAMKIKPVSANCFSIKRSLGTSGKKCARSLTVTVCVGLIVFNSTMVLCSVSSSNRYIPGTMS